MPSIPRCRWSAASASLAAAAVAIAVAGCTGTASGNGVSKTAGRGSNPPPSGIVELNLLTLPVALNLDGAPGADGVAVKLYVGAAGSTKPVALRTGEVEFLLFDGLLTQDSTRLPEPARTWRLTAKQLRGLEVQALVGTGYQVTLRWDRFQPKSDRVTVLARIPLGEGRYLYSSPGVISCAPSR